MYPVFNNYMDHSCPQSHPNNYYHPNWFSGGDFGYSNPVECHGHGCYNPAYNLVRPPHSCIPPPPPPSPPSPFYYHHGTYPPYTAGAYPPYTGAYSPYNVPPYFFMEQPKYEFDKGAQGSHCCGCPSLRVGLKNEQGPEVAKESDSLAPVKSKNEDPFPFLWLKSKNGAESSEIQCRDGNACNSLKKIRDRNENENHSQNNQGKGIPPFPFPMLWIPDYPGNKNAELSDEQPAKSKKIIPVKPLYENDDSGVRSTNNIHVEPVPESQRKESTAETGDKPKERDNEKGLANQNPQKGSKLPPVCLRVDPLPRRKSCKETPSHPSGIKLVESKAIASPVEQVRADGGKLDHKDKELGSLPPQPPRQIEVSARNETMVEERAEKKELSTVEAATLIQSFYRGFDVRKWQPLKKLKQIAKVGKQVDEIRKQIQTLKLSKDEKKKVSIGETVMSLLLQLDTIQGLHPTVREIRKGVAKELVFLQERLDSMVSQSSGVEEKPINEPKECDHQLKNAENYSAGIEHEFAEIITKNDSLPEVTGRAEEAERAEQHPAEVSQDLMEYTTKIEPPIEPFKESEEAEHKSQAKEQSLVEVAASIEPNDDSSSEPIKQVDEAEHAEPLQIEIVHETKEKDSQTEPTKDPEEPGHQLQGKEHFSDEVAMSAERPRAMEANNHSRLVLPLLNLEGESGVQAKENAENESATPENGQGEPDSIDSILVEDEPGEEELIEAQELSKLPVSFKEDESSETVVKEIMEELLVHVMDDVPPSYTDEDQEPVLQQLEDKKTSNDDPGLSGFSVTPKNELGEPESIDSVLVEDETADKTLQEAQELGSLPVYGHEESAEAVSIVEMKADSEMQEDAESLKEDGPSETVEELSVRVMDDEVPHSYTDDDQEPMLQEIEDKKTNDNPGLSGSVYLEENQPVCPSAAKDELENIYENDVHCCEETDTHVQVPEYVGSEIKDTPTEDPSKSEIMQCNKSEVSTILMEENVELREENVELRDLLRKLIKEGKEQMILISGLNSRIKSLERKLTKKKKLRMRRYG